MSGDFIGIPEANNQETFLCADFYRADERIDSKNFFERICESDSLACRGPFSEKWKHCLKLAFIINPDPKLKDLLDTDMYKKENRNHVMQNMLNLLESYTDAKYGQVSAIPYGIPSSTISGIVLGDYLLQNEQYVRTIQQLFPDCYILTHEGKVFFDPALSKEENDTKQNECIENLQQFRLDLTELGDRTISRLLEKAPKSNIEELKMAEKETSYSSTYETIKRVYSEINENGINAYMIGGISSALQAGIDLYRQNEDIDLMVDKNDLPQLIESLKKIGYSVQDKRANLTENYVDEHGAFHPTNHELDADINSPDMLGVGIFVFERKDGTVITNSYAYEENSKAVIGTQSVIPEELFDLMYSSEEIVYKGIPVKCQTKEYTYLSKSKGTRPKDKMDASVIEQYIGEDEQKKIERIRKLQKRIVRYRNTYDKDGNIVSSEKMPEMEDKIANFIAGITAQNSNLSNEELKELILSNETVKSFMEQDEDIRNIISDLQSSSLKGNLAEIARKIAHSYYFDDNSLDEQKSFSAEEIGKATINIPTVEKDKAKRQIETQRIQQNQIDEIN